MKNRIYYLALLALVAFTSCGDFEPVIYDPATGQTLPFFADTSVDLEVLINETADLDIEVGVTTLANTDRTFNIVVDTESSSALPGQYIVPATVTIPANEFFGTFTVTGVDDGLTTDPVDLVLDFNAEGTPNTSAGTEPMTISIKEICPIESTFAVGDYTLNQLSGGVPAAGFAPAMGDGVTVTLEVGGSSTERIFNVKFYPSFGFGNPPVDFSIALSCEEVITNGIVSPGVSGVGCGSSIPMAASSNTGSYSSADDSVITIVFLEDAGGASCGTEAETTVQLTKI